MKVIEKEEQLASLQGQRRGLHPAPCHLRPHFGVTQAAAAAAPFWTLLGSASPSGL